MKQSRRTFLNVVGSSAATLALPMCARAGEAMPPEKTCLVTLSFDDGFKKSFARIAEIYEMHRLSACVNVVAAGLPDDAYIKNSLGDFELWNELKRHGHEIMPHGYRHENVARLPLEQAQELAWRCLGVFSERLSGFDPKQTVFNFPITLPRTKWNGGCRRRCGPFGRGRRDQPLAAAGTGQAHTHQFVSAIPSM